MKTTTLLSFIVMAILPFVSRAQITFQKLYYAAPNTSFNDISPTSDGGYIVCGSGGSSDHILIKMNANGQTQWAKHLGSWAGNEYGYKVGEAKGGGYYLMGTTTSFNPNSYYGDINLVRMDAAGNVLWNKTYGGTSGTSVLYPSIRQTQQGEFIISASYSDNTTYGSYCFFMKIDASGNLQWSKGFAETAYEKLECYDVETSFEGNGYLAVADGNDQGILAAKCDNNGNLVWVKKYSDMNNSYMPGYSITHTSDGGYGILSSAGYYGTPMLMKIDANGNFLWSKAYNGLSYYYGGNLSSVHQTSDGGFVFLSSNRDSLYNNSYPLLVKTDGSGNFSWAKYYTLAIPSCSSSTYYQSCASVKQTPDGGYALCTSASNYSVSATLGWVIKTNSQGSTGCNEAPFTLKDSAIVLNTVVSSASISDGVSNNVSYDDGDISVSSSQNCNPMVDVSVQELNSFNNISVYPNPSNGIFTISNEKSKIKNVEVINMLGEKIYESTVNNYQASINISTAKGIYMVKIISEEGVSFSKIQVQ